MDRWKGEVVRVREEKRREEEREDQRRERVWRKKMQVREKVEKVSKHCVFPMICGSGGSKSRLAKAAGASHQARWEMNNCTPLWLEAHLEVKMYKAPHVRTCSDDFWKLRCRKSARRCGAKRSTLGSHIWKSKCTKHNILGPLLEVEMSKKCTPLWREAHFQVKTYKTHQVRNTFWSWDVEKVHAIVARSTFRSQK